MTENNWTPLREYTPENLATDEMLHKVGVLDTAGFLSGYQKHAHPVEAHTTSLIHDESDIVKHDVLGEVTRDGKILVTRNLGLSDEQIRNLFTDPVEESGVFRDAAWDGRRRHLREIRRTHNLRTTQGRDQIQRVRMFGDVGSGSLNGLTGTATATTATSLTNSGASFPTAASSAGNTGLQGHLVYCTPNNSGVGSFAVGVIVSNTGTVLTVDQWYAIPNTGAAGTTPNATCNYHITDSTGRCNWMALSTDTTSPAAGDVLRTADGLFGNGTSGGASTEQTANGLARVFVNPTFPGASQTNLANTFTYTGSGSITIAKVVLANTIAVAGSLLMLDTLLSSTANVAANGDTISINPWQITL